MRAMNRSAFWRNHAAVVGLAVLLVMVVVAVLAPWLPLPSPHATAPEARLIPPFSDGHVLGTDALGRDMLSRVLYGTRLSLGVALFGTAVAALFGTLIGLLAAYYGRLTDTVLMRGIDVLMAFPYVLLALAIIAVLGPGLLNAAIAVAIVNIPFFARTVRGAAAALRHEDFIDAARLSGRTGAGIVTAELLPNVLPVIVVAMSTTLGWMILETAGLSFLGLGAQPPVADLGGMLGQGRHLMATAPHVTVVPGLTIFLLAMSLNLIGDGLRDAWDPVTARIGAAGERQPASTAADTDTDAREPAPLLCVRELTVTFGGHAPLPPAVDRVSFDVQAGERIGLLGESGAGKSVTALALLGLLPPVAQQTGGQVLWRGRDLRNRRYLAEARGRGMAWVPQNPFASLHPCQTIGHQLTETLRLVDGCTAEQARQRAMDLLDTVRLSSPQRRLASYPHELSGGMRQRIVIAMAVAGRPQLLIADEPTTALDVTVQADVLELLQSLCDERGMSLLLVSHDLAVVSQLCSRALVFRHGRIVEQATVQALLATPTHPYTQRLVASIPRLGDPEHLLKSPDGVPA